jgi:hypothetical protein
MWVFLKVLTQRFPGLESCHSGGEEQNVNQDATCYLLDSDFFTITF